MKLRRQADAPARHRRRGGYTAIDTGSERTAGSRRIPGALDPIHFGAAGVCRFRIVIQAGSGDPAHALVGFGSIVRVGHYCRRIPLGAREAFTEAAAFRRALRRR